MVRSFLRVRTPETVKIWRAAPDGEYGAWQYRYNTAQGGASTLKEALWQASFFARESGAAIEILPEGKSDPVCEGGILGCA